VKAGILMAALAALGLAGVARADTPAAAKPKSSCFFARDWAGWHAPNKETIYFRVNVRDIYQVDLSAGGSQLLTWPDTHLIHEIHGVDSICSPIDLDLKVASDHIVIPLFIKAITKLTPEQVAAIPKKDLP
jgi:hypothetical protein